MPDILRPTADQALEAWARRVSANREQAERVREGVPSRDFYAPMAPRFRADPHRTDDPALDLLRSLVVPGETWLDIGAGGGRYTLPLALLAGEIIAVDPSEGMRGVLAKGMGEHGITNIRIVSARWPMESAPTADVALMANIGHDIEDIGPFLDAMETAARRLCVAVMVDPAPPYLAEPFWPPIHGEARVPLPALSEFLVLLLARRRLFEVRLLERPPATYAEPDGPLPWLYQQLFVEPHTDKGRQLAALVRAAMTARGDRWALSWDPAPLGIVAWRPRGRGVEGSRRRDGNARPVPLGVHAPPPPGRRPGGPRPAGARIRGNMSRRSSSTRDASQPSWGGVSPGGAETSRIAVRGVRFTCREKAAGDDHVALALERVRRRADLDVVGEVHRVAGRPRRVVGHVDLLALRDEREAGEGVGVLAAAERAQPAERRVVHAERGAVAEAPDHLLRVRGHELAVPAGEGAVGPEDQVRVEELARAAPAALVDADHDPRAGVVRRPAERLGGRPGHVDGFAHELHEVVLVGLRPVEIDPVREARDEDLRESDEARAGASGLAIISTGRLTGRSA